MMAGEVGGVSIGSESESSFSPAVVLPMALSRAGGTGR